MWWVWCRGDYFKALFRKGGMKESEEGVVTVENTSVQTLRRLLEWVYTNRVEGLSACSANEIIDLMGLAESYLLNVRECPP
jgi:3-oxoacyl-ACP reductase-like protein